MRNTGDLRLVSGLNCGGIYCFLLLSEWKEVTPSLLNSQITYWFATVNIYSDRSCKLTKTRGELIRIDPYFRLHPSGWWDVLPCLAVTIWYPHKGGTAVAISWLAGVKSCSNWFNQIGRIAPKVEARCVNQILSGRLISRATGYSAI